MQRPAADADPSSKREAQRRQRQADPFRAPFLQSLDPSSEAARAPESGHLGQAQARFEVAAVGSVVGVVVGVVGVGLGPGLA